MVKRSPPLLAGRQRVGVLGIVLLSIVPAAIGAEPAQIGQLPITHIWHIDEERAELFVLPRTTPGDWSQDLVVLDAETHEEKRRFSVPLVDPEGEFRLIVDPRHRVWVAKPLYDEFEGTFLGTRIVAVDVFDGSDGSTVVDVFLEHEVMGMVADPLRARVYLWHWEGLISVLDAFSGERTTVVELDLNPRACPQAMDVDPASGRLYVIGCRDVLYVIDAETLRLTHREPMPVGGDTIAIGPTGKIYLADWNRFTVAVLEADLSVRRIIETGGSPGTVEVSRATGRAYVPTYTNSWFHDRPGNEDALLTIDADTDVVVASMSVNGIERVFSFGPAYRLHVTRTFQDALVVTEDSTAPTSSVYGGSVQMLAPGQVVYGETRDDVSGAASVRLSLDPTSEIQPLLTCDAARRACTWSLSAPATPGAYALRATSTDRAGNHEWPGALALIVVTPKRQAPQHP